MYPRATGVRGECGLRMMILAVRRPRSDLVARLHGALCGAITAGALATGLLAGLGFLGDRVASQLLLVNLSVHLAALSALLWLTLSLVGWRILGMTGAVCGAILTVIGASKASWTNLRAGDPDATRVNVVSFNILARNERGAEIADWLIAGDADIAVILEAAPLHAERARLLARFPYSFGCDGAPKACDMFVLSRHPIISAEWAGISHHPERFAVVRLDVEGQRLTVFPMHWSKDYFSDLHNQEAYAALRLVMDHRRRDAGPFFIAGDFNSLPWDAMLRRVTKQMEVARPRVWTPTWPVAAGLLGLSIDHIFVPDTVAVEAFGLIADPMGSNHRGLTTVLAVTPERHQPEASFTELR